MFVLLQDFVNFSLVTVVAQDFVEDNVVLGTLLLLFCKPPFSFSAWLSFYSASRFEIRLVVFGFIIYSGSVWVLMHFKSQLVLVLLVVSLALGHTLIDQVERALYLLPILIF